MIINSYLTNRSFIVSVGKEYSSPGKLSCGVPQGSILAPLLFLLYVNDMPQAVNSELLLYAVTPYIHGKRYQNNRGTTEQGL